MTTMNAAGSANLSMRGDRWIRRTSMLMIGLVAMSSAVLSWSGLTFLAIQAEVPPHIAFLLPLAIDGSLVLGAALVIHGSLAGYGTKFGWGMTAFGVSLSVWGNIAAVTADSLQAQVVHAIAPICLFLSIEGLIRIVRHRITVSMEAQAEAEREALREARRREREAERAITKDAPKAKTAQAVLVSPKGGGGKVQESDTEVASYKAVIAQLPEGTSKVAMVEAILRAYPAARTGHIGFALGVDARQVGTTVHRAKAKMLKSNGIDNSATEQFEVHKVTDSGTEEQSEASDRHLIGAVAVG